VVLAVDLGLVSRPLRPDESAGLERVDLARDGVVLAAAADFPRDDLSSAEVHRLYRGELRGLRRVAEGRTNREIATELSLSPKTVDTHRTNLMRKLGVHDAQALARFAVLRGLL
jgi:DNA-binding NarL/FixJ family response regulator